MILSGNVSKPFLYELLFPILNILKKYCINLYYYLINYFPLKKFLDIFVITVNYLNPFLRAFFFSIFFGGSS